MCILLALSFSAAIAGCNAFESQADKNSREARLETARIAMDDGDYATAVALLEALGTAYPGDGEVARALAAALAGRAGLDILGLAAQAAASADNASLSAIDRFLKTLPVPVTDANIADANRAIDAWSAIASTPNDFYSLALAQLTLGLLTLDRDLNPSGTGVDPALIASMSDADLVTLYTSIDDALVNLGPGKAGLEADSDVLGELGRIKADIDARGANPDGIRAYLAAQSWT
jgi:hypothetical protein